KATTIIPAEIRNRTGPIIARTLSQASQFAFHVIDDIWHGLRKQEDLDRANGNGNRLVFTSFWLEGFSYRPEIRKANCPQVSDPSPKERRCCSDGNFASSIAADKVD